MQTACISKDASMNWSNRGKASLIAGSVHLAVSAAVAALAASLVFLLWFPYPYRELTSGKELFLLIVGIDIVCGPLLTVILFNPKKSRREIVQDLGLVALIQLAALFYGLHSISQARPVYVAFEVDRFQVITVADIQKENLHPENGGLHILPWTGPRFIGTRQPSNNQEYLESLNLSLNGIAPSMRPDWWQPYESSKISVLEKSQSVGVLRSKHASQAILINQAIKESGLNEEDVGWLPLTSFLRNDWIIFINKKTAEAIAFAHIDGF